MKYLLYFLNRLQAILIIPDYIKFKKLALNKNRLQFRLRDIWPCAFDKTSNTQYDRHYIYHPAWAARILKEINPQQHIDISSILSFSTMISAFIPTKFYDYRPAEVLLKNFSSHHQDLMNLTFESESIKSLSCMHTVEHVGLGRYGDNLDYDGDLKAMKELSRVLAPKGHLLFVVPVGQTNRIQFNAHRVYNPNSIIKEFENNGLTLVEFSLIPEKTADGGLIQNPSNELIAKQRYACGCFHFTKGL